MEIIANLKRGSRFEGNTVSVPIYGATGEKSGCLVPVGQWILKDAETIEKLMLWRKRYMRFFLSRFESSIESTTRYLRELSIGEPERLLFLIYGDDERLIGHIGISDVDGHSGELDNMVRGESGGHPQLMYYAEYAILQWAFNTLELQSIDLRVLSYNHATIDLHQRLGFKVTKMAHLCKMENGKEISHVEVNQGEENVDYKCCVMSLARDTFEQLNLQ